MTDRSSQEPVDQAMLSLQAELDRMAAETPEMPESFRQGWRQAIRQEKLQTIRLERIAAARPRDFEEIVPVASSRPRDFEATVPAASSRPQDFETSGAAASRASEAEKKVAAAPSRTSEAEKTSKTAEPAGRRSRNLFLWRKGLGIAAVFAFILGGVLLGQDAVRFTRISPDSAISAKVQNQLSLERTEAGPLNAGVLSTKLPSQLSLPEESYAVPADGLAPVPGETEESYAMPADGMTSVSGESEVMNLAVTEEAEYPEAESFEAAFSQAEEPASGTGSFSAVTAEMIGSPARKTASPGAATEPAAEADSSWTGVNTLSDSAEYDAAEEAAAETAEESETEEAAPPESPEKSGSEETGVSGSAAVTKSDNTALH